MHAYPRGTVFLDQTYPPPMYAGMYGQPAHPYAPVYASTHGAYGGSVYSAPAYATSPPNSPYGIQYMHPAISNPYGVLQHHPYVTDALGHGNPYSYTSVGPYANVHPATLPSHFDPSGTGYAHPYYTMPSLIHPAMAGIPHPLFNSLTGTPSAGGNDANKAGSSPKSGSTSSFKSMNSAYSLKRKIAADTHAKASAAGAAAAGAMPGTMRGAMPGTKTGAKVLGGPHGNVIGRSPQHKHVEHNQKPSSP